MVAHVQGGTIPGGPYSRHPLGGVIPTRWKSSGFIKGSSITYGLKKKKLITAQLFIQQNKLINLSQLSDLVGQAPHGGIGYITWVLGRHVVHERVHLPEQLPHDGEGGHVQGHPRPLLQARLVYLRVGKGLGVNGSCNVTSTSHLIKTSSSMT